MKKSSLSNEEKGGPIRVALSFIAVAAGFVRRFVSSKLLEDLKTIKPE
jgi:hypothetical protein